MFEQTAIGFFKFYGSLVFASSSCEGRLRGVTPSDLLGDSNKISILTILIIVCKSLPLKYLGGFFLNE